MLRLLLTAAGVAAMSSVAAAHGLHAGAVDGHSHAAEAAVVGAALLMLSMIAICARSQE